MAALFESGRIVDLILAFVAIEALALVWWLRGRALDIAAGLAPGIALLLALRAALGGAAWPAIAGWLALSLVAHGFDLYRRALDRRALSRGAARGPGT